MKGRTLVHPDWSIFRLAGPMFAVALTLSLALASTALAEPEFKPTGGTFTGSSTGNNVLTAGNNVITCTNNTTSGTISSAALAGGITVNFTGCKSKKGEGALCT